MTPLHASAASGAPAHVQIKLADDDARNRELFLVLRRDARFNDRTRTRRTLRRERHIVPLIDPRRNQPVPFPAVRPPRLPTRTFRIFLQRFGEGRRLSESGAPGVVQLSFEMLDLLSEALVFTA